MTDLEQIQNCKYLISRFDHYADSVNNKGNLMLAYHFFIVGGILINYEKFNGLFGDGKGEEFLILSMAISIVSLVSVFLIFIAIHPFLKSGNIKTKWIVKFQNWLSKKFPKVFQERQLDNHYESLIFFGSIASDNANSFVKKLSETNESQLSEDYQRQAYQMAFGINKKYLFLSIASLLSYSHLLIAAYILIQIL